MMAQNSPLPNDRCEHAVRKGRRTWSDYRLIGKVGEGASGTFSAIFGSPRMLTYSPGAVYKLAPVTYPSESPVVFKVAHGNPEHDTLIQHEWAIGSLLAKRICRRDLPTIFFVGRSTCWGRPCIFLEEGLMTAYDFFCLVRINYPRETLIAEIGRVAAELVCYNLF